MKKVVLVLLFLCPFQPALAHDKKAHCRPVGIQCVAVVMKTDGSFWLADRNVERGKYVWEPIKPTDCPNANDGRLSVYVSTDPVYGAYRCVYPGEDHRGGVAPMIGTKWQRVWRYMGTHKLLLTTDAALVLSSIADSASSYNCEQTSAFCSEENPMLPRHPSAAQLYGVKLGMTAGIITFDHWWYHRSRWWGYEFWTAPLIFSSVAATKHNVNLAEKLSSGQVTERERLGSDVPTATGR
jgi:hypothetical protein